ncbi:MAG: hypothetical protein EA397_11660 [Deltaproteobacteria bacterium]|nr:MAG: hypothetical protein EA397_11660 [Deltaproteobacteria bacterium]
MTRPSSDVLSLPWFQAPDTAAQTEAIDALVLAARSSSRAVGELIMLLHLARDASEQLPLLRALGETGSTIAVPALHGELHHEDPAVRIGALRALGATERSYAGVRVAAWLGQVTLDEEPSEVLEAALTALGQTGHPSVDATATLLWQEGRVRAEVIHIALAEAGSSTLLDEARTHLNDPSAALSAALHLVAARAPDREQALERLRASDDLPLRRVADVLLAMPFPSAEDDMLTLLEAKPSQRARTARRLRGHDPATLVEAFHQAISLEGPQGVGPLCEAAVEAGIEALQDAALDEAAKLGDEALARALRKTTLFSPALRAALDGWIRAPSEVLARAAIRVAVNLEGVASLDRIERQLQPDRAVHQIERIRAYQDTLRDWRGGPAPIPHALRQRSEQVLREALDSPDPGQRTLGAYAAGNIGLNALGAHLRKALSDPQASVREAAATALCHLPPSSAPALLDRLREEPAPSVRFRLALALVRAFEIEPPPPDLQRLLPERLHEALASRDDLDVLRLRLLGFAASEQVRATLCQAATGPVLSRAAAAISALGTLSDPATSPTLMQLLQHPDPARRWRAAEALARLAEPASTLALIETLDDPELVVRRAALHALRTHPLEPATRAKIRPTGPDDPLLFELIALTRGDGSQASLSDVDERLRQAVPAFEPARLHRRCPDALRALRTAEFLCEAGELPEGLDAAPPVLLWAKGLELWASEVLRPCLQHLALPASRSALEHAAFKWTAFPRRHQEWPARAPWPPLRPLLQTLQDYPRLSPSLNNVAALVLIAGPLASEIGVRRSFDPAMDPNLFELAHSAASLATLRNALTHRRAAHLDEADRARALALRAIHALASLR